MARSEPGTNVATGRRAAASTRALLRIRLPKLTIKGKPATREVAVLTNALIGILNDASSPGTKCLLVVTLAPDQA